MTGVCVGLKPQSIEDITAIIALYRPGPMDSIPQFIACKHDPSKVSYMHPVAGADLCPSLTAASFIRSRSSRSSSSWPGYSLGQADMVRRAMSKKKAKDVAKEREAFLHGDPARNIKGCVANGIPDPAAAEEIYDEIYAFANYAFNKAHAVSYAVVAYQTAYFKCHFPREYMAALLTSVLDNSDKVSGYIGECRECGIALLPPDINRSADRFTVEEGGIRFGLVAIKNIGRGFIQAVMRERETGGDFTSLYDFCSRMNGSEMNKRAVENLIRSGAFDSMGARRSQLIKVYESVMDSVAAQQRENVEGQMDFFSMAADNDEKSNSVKEIPLPDIPEYTPEELMTMEKATTGLYLSGHPMDHYRDAVRKLHAPTIVSIIEDFSRENGPDALHRRPADHHCRRHHLQQDENHQEQQPYGLCHGGGRHRLHGTAVLQPGAGDLRCLHEGKSGSGGKGAAVRPGRKGPPDHVRLHLPSVHGGGRHPGATAQAGGTGGDPVPEIPQHRRSRHPPHEAGVPDVPRQKRGENGHGGHPKGLCYPGVTAPGIGAGSSGDAGSRKCGSQITAKDPKSPAFGIFRRPGLV